ncbi:MAG: FHA domain-containing protein [Labilithrix sp.]|nr:FHA domain-containing protein [Labilithrix sp.]MCW5810596.1 FHA domain-containing protein [Labilithrix sp.]
MDEARLQRWLNGQRRSHQRTFQSREMVWQTFEQLAREQGASIDQLIGEAMEAYAEARGYHVEDDPPEPEPDRWASPAMHDRDPLEETHDAPGLSDLDRSYMPPAPAPRRAPSFDSNAGWEDSDLARTETRDAIRRPTPPEPTRPIPAAGRPAYDDIREPGEESRTTPRYLRNNPSAATPIQPLQPPVPAAIQRPVPTGPMNPRATRPLPPPGSRPLAPPVTAPPPFGAPPPPARDPLRDSGSNPARLRDTGSNPSAPKRLVLMHRGQRVEVDKDRFLLGRSKTQADLRLDDPNVSRQHAAIERVGSAWYIVDLGSTNGVYVAGERITRRALADGDTIVITSHEIRCSLR